MTEKIDNQETIIEMFDSYNRLRDNNEPELVIIKFNEIKKSINKLEAIKKQALEFVIAFETVKRTKTAADLSISSFEFDDLKGLLNE
jgi:hypothetical protein